MQIRRYVLTSITVFACLLLLAAEDQTPSPIKFAPGQRWAYHTRPQDDGSTLLVLKVESDPRIGTIVSVSVSNLHLKNPQSPDGFSSNVQHMPFALAALEKSVTKLLTIDVPLPQFEESYRTWRDAFDAGHAGIYTISVSEAVQVMEDTLNKGTRHAG